MAERTLFILTESSINRDVPEGCRKVRFGELAGWLRRGTILRHLFGYSDVVLRTYRRDCLFLPFATSLALRLLSRGSCRVEDFRGDRMTVTLRSVARYLRDLLRDLTAARRVIQSTWRQVEALANEPREKPTLDLAGPPLYLRTDLSYGVRSGGSVGHIAGVLNNLDRFTGKPIFVTTDRMPTARTDIETQIFPPPSRFWNMSDLLPVAFNQTAAPFALKIVGGRRLSFIYQRYSMHNFTGVQVSRRLKVPLVIEYNGSELWIYRNWGKGAGYPRLMEAAELLVMRSADLIVAVSEPLKTELVARGIEADKILVNANGVDLVRYRPDISGDQVRRELGLDGTTTVGFIGTFGMWHGAEVLADAFGRMLRRRPDLGDSVRLLLIGDGATRRQVEDSLARHGATKKAILTGLIPQQDGPAHLAACDVLVAPHIPNRDGTAFFGSPTKLYEYMAMGKGIVASNLEQIGQVIEHDKTGWLVEPGNAESLAQGILDLVLEPERRRRLGQAARGYAENHCSWQEHTRKIVSALEERFR